MGPRRECKARVVTVWSRQELVRLSQVRPGSTGVDQVWLYRL